MQRPTKFEFMHLMHIPSQWDEWGMYPDELFAEQISRYESGHEEGAEHDRNGMFHWWLRRQPTKEQLKKLAQLTLLDPDPLMGEDVRNYIRQSPYCDEEIRRILK